MLSWLAWPWFRWPDQGVFYLTFRSNDQHLSKQLLGADWTICQHLWPCARLGDALYGAGQAPDLALLLLDVMLLGALLLLPISDHRRLKAAGVGLLWGGAIGNGVDILGDGAVTDYIALGPDLIANIADLGLVAGVACLAVIAVRAVRGAVAGLLPSRPPATAAPPAPDLLRLLYDPDLSEWRRRRDSGEAPATAPPADAVAGEADRGDDSDSDNAAADGIAPPDAEAGGGAERENA